jgi:hypothetical protein
VTEQDLTAQATVPDQPAETSLRDRVPGQSVIGELLARQHERRPRSLVARAFGRSPLSASSRPWYWGALGEIAVGRRLSHLGKEWTVLHAVPVGERDVDIDHIVIGPGGVFTVNTKNHSDQRVWVAGRTFMVAGQKQDHIRNSEHEARRAARLLSAAMGRPVDVSPVLAVVQPRTLTIRTAPERVVVMHDDRLVRWLKKRPPLLTAADVERVSEVASRPRLWRTGAVEVADVAALWAGFRRLDREVRVARRLRRTWGLGAAGASGYTAIVHGPGLLSGLLTGVLGP